MGRLITVSNRLPVNLEIEDGELVSKPSVGGLATGLSSFYKSRDSLWVGWSGLTDEQLRDGDEERLEEILSEVDCHPVYLTSQQIEKYYEGFANKTLWPLFHYFPMYVEADEEYREVYGEVNREFCDVLLKIITPDDEIWVHDYHLMLLPSLIREEMEEVSIGFFLHIPFPAFEIFRLLPWREDILRGLLGADLVGFHTYDYSQHFLNCARYLLGLEYERGQLMYSDRMVKVDAFPMGIDYERFTSAVETDEAEAEIEKIHKRVGDRKVILSIDRLDYTKGILDRLSAFELFLEEYPQYHDEVTLIMLTVPSRVGVDTYAELKQDIDEIVGRINSRFGTVGWVPIWYLFRSVPFERLVALYNIADIGLVTPLRDGMNLVSKEFIACKTDGEGVLILSEMAGASKELGEAISVNPYDQREMAEALHLALQMSPERQVKSNRVMQERLKRYDVTKWALDFMEQLRITKEKQVDFERNILTRKTREELIERYKESEKRLILLDYDGTLISFSKSPDDAVPDVDLIELLKKLNRVEGNEVVIVSGRDRDSLSEWFGPLNLSMIAEHGAWIKVRDSDWDVIEPIRDEWKEELMPIFDKFVDRTPGTFIEEKDCSLTVHYRKAMPELVNIRIGDIRDNLMHFVANQNLEVLEGNKVLEVRNAGVNKGRASLTFIDEDSWDFILAIGDDRTDEDIFASLPEDAISIKVGGGPTRAKYNLNSVGDVRSLITKLSDVDYA